MKFRILPMQDVFVVSDVHGHYDELVELMRYHKNELVIFIGDLIDKGYQSKEVLQYVMELVRKNKAIAIKGNHEELFLDFLEQPLLAKSYMLGIGYKTIQSLLGVSPNEGTDAEYIAENIKEKYPEIIYFLQTLPAYIEMDNYLFVHAGINPALLHWSHTKESDMRWIREEFYRVPNNTGKVIIFGHTPTYLLRNNEDASIWESGDGYIGIDGGIGNEKQLNALNINMHSEVKMYDIKSTKFDSK